MQLINTIPAHVTEGPKIEELGKPTIRLRTADDIPGLQDYIEIRKTSVPSALRQHERAVQTAAISLGTPST
mgnify:CR=1 FL=1